MTPDADPVGSPTPSPTSTNHPEAPMSPTSPTSRLDVARRRRIANAVKIALAGGALLGMGAAATSAAWTDQANFSATAASATVGLQGSLNGTTWFDANTASTSTGVAADLAISVPAATFTGLVPNPNNTSQVTRSVTLYLRSTGSAPTAVSTACTPSGDLFTGAAPLIVTFDAAATTATSCTRTFTFAAGDTAAQSTVLKVTVPAAWPQTYAGKSGSLVVTFTGTAQTS
jgi:predicted ribosomally synthesized peptide with SipW-like signal peptide